MNLHLVFTSPNNSSALRDCLNNFQEQDGLILLEDGVLAITNFAQQSLPLNNKPCFALESDLKARGIEHLCPLPIISYDDFVELTLKYNKTISWR